MNIILYPLQAFNAITQFLDFYYKKSLFDDLGILLSSMKFLEDNQTVDAAMWDDWIIILGTHQILTELQAFNAMVKYLTLYADLMDSEDLRNILDEIDLSDKTLLSSDIWDNWTRCINNTLKAPENAQFYLKLTK